VGQGLTIEDDPVATSAPGAAASKDVAKLVLTITDDNDLHPAGIPVVIAGPKDATVVSGRDGIVRFSGPPGFYTVKVKEGCQDSVVVQDGGSGKLGLVEGQTLKGELEVIWLHRYGPSGPVTTDAGSRWTVGKNVVVTYDVHDRCSDDRAPKARYPTYVFDTSKNLRVIGTPALVADADGQGKLTLRCASNGDVKLVARDTANPSETLDLIALAIGYDGVPRCA
jgi:hypothetical protein